MLLDVGVNVNVQDNEGFIVMMCVCEYGYIEIVKILLVYFDCDVIIVDNVRFLFFVNMFKIVFLNCIL